MGFDYHFGVPNNHGDPFDVLIENDHIHGLGTKRFEPYSESFCGAQDMGFDEPQGDNKQTMTQLTDRAVSDDTTVAPDSVAFLPSLLGEKNPAQRTSMVTQMRGVYRLSGKVRASTLRTGTRRARRLVPPFNLSDDPDERVDLIDTRQGITQDLEEELKQIRADENRN